MSLDRVANATIECNTLMYYKGDIMAISLRLDPATNRRLTAAAKATGVTKSEFVRMCITEYLENGSRKPTPWELGKDLFGCFDSGRSDLSVRASEIFGEMMDAKHARRRRR